jgi:hypothetical protein
MIKISKRFVDRAKKRLRRYQRLLESARTRDVNESDTVVIVTDFLHDVLGYDKYTEITSEFSVRSTFCDLALRIGGELVYLIEVKSAGTDLRDNHLRQAVDYAANQGIETVMLTNGVIWQVYRVRFEQPISHDLILSIDLLDPAQKAAKLVQDLYLISREGTNASDLDRYCKQREATSRYVVSQLLLTDPFLRLLRREIRKVSSGISVTTEHLAALLRNEVIKRDALEGEKAAAAGRLIKRAARRRLRAEKAEEEGVAKVPDPAIATGSGAANKHDTVANVPQKPVLPGSVA